MGLLDSLANEALSAISNKDASAGNSGDAAVDAAVAAAAHPGMMDVIIGLLDDQSGVNGLSGLVNTAQRLGLGNIVESWVGTGHNLPISAAQIQSVFGPEQLGSIAQKLGLPPELAAQALAHVLPKAVDHVTPDGQLPPQRLVEQGLSLFKSFSAGR